MDKLSEEQISQRISNDVPEWSLISESITRTYQFGDFTQSMQFVTSVADVAESVQHHPDILIRYNKVSLTLSTHDAGGITEKDFDLAHQADDLAESLNSKG